MRWRDAIEQFIWIGTVVVVALALIGVAITVNSIDYNRKKQIVKDAIREMIEENGAIDKGADLGRRR